MVGLIVATHFLAWAARSDEPVSPIWIPAGVADDADSHVAFRGAFSTSTNGSVLKILGASEYLVWLDGKLIHDGPARYAKAFPEYQAVPLATSTGRHILAVQVRNDGVTTRILSDIRPFLWCAVQDGDRPATVEWKCARIPGYRPRAHRISDILGWIDWCDTNHVWPGWQEPSFDDSKWPKPIVVDRGLGPIAEAKTRPVRLDVLPLKPMARGSLAATYGYEQDEPSTRFFLDDLDPKDVPAQGEWRRYDLGRVRLGRPKLTLDLAPGSIVEYAVCEQLRYRRVHPWITLSGSTTCNLDHFVARGGPQEFMPFTPKGGRFLEVHIRSSKPVKFLKEEFLERTYYQQPIGSFECDDALLNKIWKTGVETMRACSEDSFVDCPTRERGEWTGDVASVATDIAAVAYGDLSLSRRALVQAAQVAREDGLVAGVGPGDPGYLSTYAAQWVTACVHYWELTGDKSLLEELFPAAKKNMAAFAAKLTSEGVKDDLGWAFVDWGYVRNEGPTDMALNMHYLLALWSMARWEQALGKREQGTVNKIAQVSKLVMGWIAKTGNVEKIGYHRATLAMMTGLLNVKRQRDAVAMIKKHLLSCFPNDPNGPRLSDPGVTNDRVMTPYFAHFAFAALLNCGEIDFVLGQYRKCWGWALGDGRTTWLEVFDTRWSHCHEWSGCPTWQLSRYVLGLRPRFDLGERVFEFDVLAGNLKHATGDVPFQGGKVHVEWTRSGRTIKYVLTSSVKVRVWVNGREKVIDGRFEGSKKSPSG